MARKKLVIAIPHAPQGQIHADLAAWITAVEVAANTRRVLEHLKGEMLDLGDRVRLGEAAEIAGCDWMARRLAFFWADKKLYARANFQILPENWDVFCVSVAGRPICDNRNQIGRFFLHHLGEDGETFIPTDFEALLQVDSDVVPDPQHLRTLCDALDREDVDAVGGIYEMTSPTGPTPLLYKLNGREGGRLAPDWLTCEDDLIELENGAMGAGFLAVKRYVLEEMIDKDRIWFKDRFRDGSLEAFELQALIDKHEGKDSKKLAQAIKKAHGRRVAEDFKWQHMGEWQCGEDIWFCREMQACGFKLFAHRGIHLRHHKEVDLRKAFMHAAAQHRAGFRSGYEAAGGKLDEGSLDDQEAFSGKMRAQAVQTAAIAQAELKEKPHEPTEHEHDGREPEGVRGGEHSDREAQAEGDVAGQQGRRQADGAEAVQRG